MLLLFVLEKINFMSVCVCVFFGNNRSSLSMYRIVSRVRPAHDSLFSTDPLQVMHTTCAQLDHIAHFITDHTGHPDARS